MVDLIRWFLVTLGLIYFITESSLFAIIRVTAAELSSVLRMLLYCQACSGFWIGIATAAWLWPFGVGGDGWMAVSVQLIEGGIATMGLGALWSHMRGGNPAWHVEGWNTEGAQDDDSSEKTSG